MYIETIKNLFCDEVAETLAAIGQTQAIQYKGFLYRIPRSIVHSGYNAVTEWRTHVLHGIRGDMDVLNMDSIYIGSIPVWTLHNMLAHETFTIRSMDADENTIIIHNAEALAQYLDTTIEKLPDIVHEYHDYETYITLETDKITLRTIAGDTGKELCKELYFPFSDDAYENAHVGLQCWADATYWDAVHGGEV